MKYNFDKITPRRNTNSCKWDSAGDDAVLPMWVADMDFVTAPPIIETLIQRAQHGIFGYTKIPNAYYDAVISWFSKRHNFEVQKSWILYTTGVMPAISAIIQALTATGDKVIIQSPVYNCFYPVISDNGREIISNDLFYKDGTYNLDFAGLEKITADPKAKLLLLCHPHNPVGRVWTRKELETIGDICLRNQVIVVSDEIHCDFVYLGHQHIPFASINSDFLYHSVTCTSPSKTFNIAGLQTANIFAADSNIRERIGKVLITNRVAEINSFGVEGLIAAYNEGEDWLQELLIYLYGNYQYLKEFLDINLPQLKVLSLQATYLVWIDCSALQQSSKEISGILLNKGKLWLNEGVMYGANGNHFMRINIACSRPLLSEGLKRMKQVLSPLFNSIIDIKGRNYLF
ncbi:Cystathionine beta-lyase PatB [termite gut metagenome]|uniref:cysteine-S-conjugate beta-lyase n=1 Tax=termite gut metagenome TaxID=433724 RepID=A0A5J4QKK2_9ZZZZ